MDQPQLKPKYLVFTEKWASKAGLVWSMIFAVIGIHFIGMAEGIGIPLMTVMMLFIGRWIIKLLISTQKASSEISRKVFDYVIIFFWAFGIYGFLALLMKGAFNQFAEPDTYFYVAASIFPLGISLGAAEKWEQRFCYE